MDALNPGSSPERRIKLRQADGVRTPAGKRESRARDELDFPLRGLRRYRATQRRRRQTRRIIQLLVPLPEGGRVSLSDCSRELELKARWSGMGAGLAKRPGNAGGVKALTVITRRGANIHHTQRWRRNGK